jgi:hypothetical protein
LKVKLKNRHNDENCRKFPSYKKWLNYNLVFLSTKPVFVIHVPKTHCYKTMNVNVNNIKIENYFNLFLKKITSLTDDYFY